MICSECGNKVKILKTELTDSDYKASILYHLTMELGGNFNIEVRERITNTFPVIIRYGINRLDVGISKGVWDSFSYRNALIDQIKNSINKVLEEE